MQLVNGALLALATVVSAAIIFSVAIMAAASLSQGGQAPRGKPWRDLPRQPVPDDDHARELVLR
jgi:hypothetical protein